MIRLREKRRDYAEAGERRDAFEDFLILHNAALLRKLRKAREEHSSGKTQSWEEFKRDFVRPRSRQRMGLPMEEQARDCKALAHPRRLTGAQKP